MAEITELWVALTVAEFDEALAFYRDALGLRQLPDWSSVGRVVLLEARRARLELMDEAQAATVECPERSDLRSRCQTAKRSPDHWSRSAPTSSPNR